ncbi:unnamed protein product [Darwinula stevensoni]|uniref:Uncharacterized protein n=1 Tax=Darwinula stevensoni TaxID=69355 RepID=A0A7R9FNT5_9CRUS|nr:unnamed protein product [Darwinula stevensoni]CAG0897100.1 unnamed protein product [Darwinula stevensoni]
MRVGAGTYQLCRNSRQIPLPGWQGQDDLISHMGFASAPSPLAPTTTFPLHGLHIIRDNWVDATNVPPKESAEGIWGCTMASDSDSTLVTSTRMGTFPPRMVEVGERCKACRVSLVQGVLQTLPWRRSSSEVYPDRGEAPLVARVGVGDEAFFQQEPPSSSPPHTASPSTSDTLAEHASSEMQQAKVGYVNGETTPNA